MERDLPGHDFVALVLDGKAFGKGEMVIAVGITIDGKKVALGFAETVTRNEVVCTDGRTRISASGGWPARCWASSRN